MKKMKQCGTLFKKKKEKTTTNSLKQNEIFKKFLKSVLTLNTCKREFVHVILPGAL